MSDIIWIWPITRSPEPEDGECDDGEGGGDGGEEAVVLVRGVVGGGRLQRSVCNDAYCQMIDQVINEMHWQPMHDVVLTRFPIGMWNSEGGSQRSLPPSDCSSRQRKYTVEARSTPRVNSNT